MAKRVWNSKKSRIEVEKSVIDRFGEGLGKVFGAGLDTTIGVFDVIIKGLFLLPIIVGIGFIVYIFAADLVLGSLGIIKAETPISVAIPTDIFVEDTNVITISHQSKPYVGVFSIQDGQAVAKSTTLNQSFYLSYDGMLIDGGFYLIPSIVEPKSASATFETERVLIISFCDSHGTSVSANSVTMSCSNGDTLCGTALNDGRYFLLLPEDASDMTLTFSAEGYDSTAVYLNWNQHRTGELEVCFNAQ